MTKPMVMRNLFYLLLVFPLSFSCNKDIDNDVDDVPSGITDGQWMVFNRIDSLGQQAAPFPNVGSCYLSSYYTFNSDGFRYAYLYNFMDFEANEDCVLDSIFIHPYQEISDNYYRIYNNDIDNLNIVQDVYIYNDTMSVSHNIDLSDWNSGVTTYFIRQ